jgi:serine/threonine protein kinase
LSSNGFRIANVAGLTPISPSRTANLTAIASLNRRLCVFEIMSSTRNDPYKLAGAVLAGKYLLEESAALGGQGIVYRGRTLEKGEIIAVKIVRPDLLVRQAQADLFLKLFRSEVATTRTLLHPHIVKVYDSGEENNLAYIVMEWLIGRSLGEELANSKAMSLTRCTEILRQVCSALALAHKQKILHLDIKPNNIFLIQDPSSQNPLEDRPFVKVIDFGLARVLQSTVGTTLSRYVGTPNYSAPEVFANKASYRSDIYSLGVTTFELLTGTIPFGQSQIAAMIRQHLEDDPPSLLKLRPDIPPLLDQVVQRAMNKRPDKRHRSVEDFFDDFDRATKTGAIKSAKTGPRLGTTLLVDKAKLGQTRWERFLDDTSSVQMVSVIGFGIILAVSIYLRSRIIRDSASAILFGWGLEVMVFADSSQRRARRLEIRT